MSRICRWYYVTSLIFISRVMKQMLLMKTFLNKPNHKLIAQRLYSLSLIQKYYLLNQQSYIFPLSNLYLNSSSICQQVTIRLEVAIFRRYLYVGVWRSGRTWNITLCPTARGNENSFVFFFPSLNSRWVLRRKRWEIMVFKHYKSQSNA